MVQSLLFLIATTSIYESVPLTHRQRRRINSIQLAAANGKIISQLTAVI